MIDKLIHAIEFLLMFLRYINSTATLLSCIQIVCALFFSYQTYNSARPALQSMIEKEAIVSPLLVYNVGYNIGYNVL